MDVVRLSNIGAAVVVAAVALLSGTHLGRAQTSAPVTAPFVSADELARRLDDAWRPAVRTPAFSLSGPVLPPPTASSPTSYGASLYPLPRFRSAPNATFDALIDEASRRFGIPPSWVRGVMRIESGGRTMLDGRPITSPAGAMGLMQVMPATFAELSGRYGLGSDPYEPRANILAGAAYLREMYDRFGPAQFLAAYNAGPGRVDEHLRTGRALPGETKRYVQALGVGPDGDLRTGGTAAPPVVRDLTSLDALRAATLPPSRRLTNRPGVRQASSVFVAATTARSALDREPVQRPSDALFVALTHRDQRIAGISPDGPQE